MNARAHIDLGDNIRNLLELPLTDYVQDQENIQTFVSVCVKICLEYSVLSLFYVDDQSDEGIAKYENAAWR